MFFAIFWKSNSSQKLKTSVFSLTDHIKYGKRVRIIGKLMFSLLFLQLLCTIFIPIFKDIAIFMLSLMPVILVLLFMNMKVQLKYHDAKDEYDYQRKYNPNFEREQKLKRILKNV